MVESARRQLMDALNIFPGYSWEASPVVSSADLTFRVPLSLPSINLPTRHGENAGVSNCELLELVSLDQIVLARVL